MAMPQTLRSSTSTYPERVGLVGLAALTLVGPWINGGFDPLPQWCLQLLGVVISICLFLDQRQRATGSVYPWILLISLLGLGLIASHLLPVWPTRFPNLVPQSVALRTDLSTTSSVDRSLVADSSAPFIGTPNSDLPALVPLTLDVHATRHMLSMLGLALIGFVAAMRWIRTLQQFDRFARLLSWNGVALTLFAVLVKATWNGKLFWFIEVGFGRGVFGSMIYHNLAGNILMMTSAASIYLILRGSSAKAIGKNGQSPQIMLASKQRWTWPTADTLMLWIVCGCNLAGLLLTLSRGALLAFMISSAVALVLLKPRTSWRDFLLPTGVVLLGVAGLVVWFRASDIVSRRYATLMQSDQLLADVRLDHWQDGFRAGESFGIFGVGAGAYRHIHPLFQDTEIERVFLRAHNQYLETWVDSGLPGILLLLLSIAMTFMILRWLSARRDESLRQVAALGIVITLGQAIHAGVDFCLYIPAAAIHFAVMLGAISAIAWEAGKIRQASLRSIGFNASHPLMLGTTAVLILVNLSSCWMGARWAIEESAIYRIPWNMDNRKVKPEVLASAIQKLETLSLHTDDWRVPLSLGELYLIDYRQQLAKILKGEMPPEATAVITDEEIWQLTDPMVIFGRSYAIAAEKDWKRLHEEIRDQPLIAGRLAQAHAQFRWSRRLCPMVAQVQLRLGELAFVREKFDGTDLSDLEHVEKLGVGDADMLYEVGRRYALANQRQAALGVWRKSLALSTRHWGDIYRLIGTDVTPSEMLSSLMPPNPRLMLSIAGRQFTEPEQKGARQKFLQRASDLIGERPKQERAAGEWHMLRAELALLENDRASAIEHVTAAVHIKPEDHSLRAQLAQLLALQERWEEALQEARYCLGLQPNNWEYKALIDRIQKQRKSGIGVSPVIKKEE